MRSCVPSWCGRCKPVYDIVRFFVKPATFDVGICRIRSWNQCHCSDDFTFLAGYITMSVIDVPKHDALSRIAVSPLKQIAALAHNLLGIFEYPHKGFKV